MLKYLGIDVEKSKALFKTFFINELRFAPSFGTRAIKRSGLNIPITMGVLNAFFGLLVSFATVRVLPIYEYSLLVLSISFIFIFLVMIGEFGLKFITEFDYTKIGYMPVDSRTFAFTKLISFLVVFYLSFFLPLILPSAIIGIWGKNSGLPYPLFLIPLHFSMAVFTIFFVLSFYLFLMQFVNILKLRGFLMYIQIALLLGAYIGYVLIQRIIYQLRLISVTDMPWYLYLLPPVWFSAPIKLVFDKPGSGYLIQSIIGFCIMMLTLTIWFRVSKNYTHRISKGLEHLKKKVIKKPKNIILALIKRVLLIRKNTEELGFNYVYNILRSNYKAKFMLFDLLGAPLVIFVIAVFSGRWLNPFIGLEGTGRTMVNQSWEVVVVFSLIACYGLYLLPTIDYAYGEDWKASWLFFAGPLRKYGSFFNGVKKALLYNQALVFIGLFILNSLLWNLKSAFYYSFLLILEAITLLHIASIFSHDLPFSKAQDSRMKAKKFFITIVVIILTVVVSLINCYLFTWNFYYVSICLIVLNLILSTLSELYLNKKVVLRGEY